MPGTLQPAAAQDVASPVSARFLLLLALGLLAGSAAWPALVLYTTSWAEARDLDRIFPFYAWRTPYFPVATFEAVRRSLALVAGSSTLAMLGLSWPPAGRREWLALGQEGARGLALLRLRLTQLSDSEHLAAGVAFGLLTALRVFFSITNPGYDDAVSYEVFVNKGLLATTAFYPVPNNHVFSNTISWLFFQINPGFWWSMRLPVLLISTLGTAYLFAALLRCSNFRVALLAPGLFSCLQLSLYHAGVGRGYWLMISLAGVVFFSTLHLAEGGSRPRAAWAALLLSCVLGGYTVPPFAYVAASGFGWLGWQALRRQNWRCLAVLVVAGLVTLAANALLYTPLMLVSGADQLLGNGYVRALPTRYFWTGLPLYAWYNEGFLVGQRTIGALLTVAGLGLLAWLCNELKNKALPAETSRLLRQLAGPALWFVLLPYALIIAQRVFPPERTLLYKGFFFFILAGIIIDWAMRRWPAPAYRWPRQVLAMSTVLFISYEAWYVGRVNHAARATNGSYRAGLHWLAGQPPGAVLNPETTLNLFFRFYAHTEVPGRPWRFDATPQPGQHYAYVVAFAGQRRSFHPKFDFAPAYDNGTVLIYRIPPGYNLQANSWIH